MIRPQQQKASYPYTSHHLCRHPERIRAKTLCKPRHLPVHNTSDSTPPDVIYKMTGQEGKGLNPLSGTESMGMGEMVVAGGGGGGMFSFTRTKRAVLCMRCQRNEESGECA